MRAHVIENGVVVNTILVESLDFMPNLVDASLGGEIGWDHAGNTFTPPPVQPVRPEPLASTVSPRQIRQALTRAGLRTQVEAAVAAGDQDLKDWWEFATEFQRQHPMVLAMGAGLGQSEAQMDDLWRLAASI